MAISVTDVVVRTAQGPVRGRAAGGVVAFKGIPYAAPPFGPNRFRPRQPHAPWDGVREALEYGPTAPKPPYPEPLDAVLPEPVIEGDERLNLNIWTPDASARGLPVLVWIHGGAFTNGSDAVPAYDGTAFARDGVVCVGSNYRLGVDGFLFLGDGVAHLGLLDQVAALRWVRDNIAAFGGDPDQVTIAGESAGGMSVTTLLSMPLADGLFRRVIAESGAGHHALSRGTAQRVGGYLADKLGVPATREALAQVPLATLRSAQMELGAEATAAPDPARWGEVAANYMLFEPVVEGAVLPRLPIESIAAGAGGSIDLLTGTTSEEWRLLMVPGGGIDTITEDVLRASAAAPTGCLPARWTATARRGRAPRRATCSRRWPPTGSSASPRSGWRRRARGRQRAPPSTSSAGARRLSMGGRAPVTEPRSPSRSTLSASPRTGPGWGQARRKPWPTRCTAPGCRSARPATRAGRATASTAAAFGASDPHPRRSRTRPARSAGSGTASAEEERHVFYAYLRGRPAHPAARTPVRPAPATPRQTPPLDR